MKRPTSVQEFGPKRLLIFLCLGLEACSSKQAPNGLFTTTAVSVIDSAPTGSVDGMRDPLDDSWRDQSSGTATDVLNRRGPQRHNATVTQALESPEAPRHDGAGNGNFRLDVPLLDLPGRGLNLSLALAYNSRVWSLDWTRQKITFDVDADWLAAGWSLGFGKLVDLGSNIRMLVDGDGTRHPFEGPFADGSYRTKDGTLIDYKFDPQFQSWVVKYSNGTTVTFGASGAGAVYPSRITDVNGNYISIAYFGSPPFIQYVQDTLGRTVTFHYDTTTFPVLLTSITAPGLDAGADRTIARFHYRQFPLNFSFASRLQAEVRLTSTPWLLDAIYFPATATGYWFAEPDSFSSYGMIKKVIQQRGMGFTPGAQPDLMGSVTRGTMSHQWEYSYPSQPDSSLEDAPTFDTVSESWDQMTDGPAITTYHTTLFSEPRVEEIIYPSGLHEKRFSHFRQMSFDDGLVYLQEMRDGSNRLLRSQNTSWESGSTGPRIASTVLTNERGWSATTQFNYASLTECGACLDAPLEVRSYDYAESGLGNLLKKQKFEYETNQEYQNNHIYYLKKTADVYQGDGTRASHTEYSYDDFSLTPTPGGAPVHYSPQSSPFRGNLTKVTAYANAVDAADPSTESRYYDVTGNLIQSASSCCEQTTIEYQLDTQFAYATAVTRGAVAEDPSARVTIRASYDYNTGIRRSSTDANGGVTWLNHEAQSLRLQEILLPTGAAIEYAYDDAAMTVEETRLLAPLQIALDRRTTVNGVGLVRLEERWSGGSNWDAVSFAYDSMKRRVAESLPYRSGQTPRYSTFSYDLLSRITQERLPDAPAESDRSTVFHYYNETTRPDAASALLGDTARNKDAWGREQWTRTDALGRLAEVVEPNPSGDGSVFLPGSLATSYRYNAADSVAEVRQGTQQRLFKYDGLGRLTHQKLAERSATLDNGARYVGASGSWTDVFSYDIRSNLTSHTDARGVKKIYRYDGDPLNRLQGVSYDTSGFGDTANPIVAAPDVTYAYMPPPGDVARPLRIVTAGVNTEEYGYDSAGRLNSKTVKMAGREGYAAQVEYIHDNLNRLTDVRYPRQYGMPGEIRRLTHSDLDVAGRPSGLKVDGVNYAWQFAYNPASQVTSLNVGTGGPGQLREEYEFEDGTGLSSRQKVWRGASLLLDLSYSYLRPGTTSGRTTKVSSALDNLNHNRDKHYLYDALNRLVQMRSGQYSAPFWTMDYAYDRYGNRTSVAASGYISEVEGSGAQEQDIQQPLGASGNGATFISQNVPNFMFQGTNVSVSITMQNSGQTPWQRLQHRLGSQNPPDNMVWGTNRMDFAVPIVTPGNQVTFQRLVRAPQTEGTYNFQWQMIEGAEWFGDLTANVPVRVIPQGPLPPSNLRLTVMSGSEIDLSWTRNSTDEDGFEIERKIGLSGTYSSLASVGPGSTTYSDRTVQPGTTYYYRVRTFYLPDRRSPSCDPARATTFGPPPTDGLASLSVDGSSNRINTPGFAYDAAGNQTRTLRVDGTWQRNQYDAAGRLAKVKNDAGDTIELYSYDYARRRVRTQLGDTSNSRTYYIWDGWSVIAEYTESDASPNVPLWSQNYVYLANRLLATLAKNGEAERIQYHHPDRLGTRLVTDAADPEYFKNVTLPFGTALGAESTIDINRPFTSYDRSARTGLDYAVNRHYDAAQGRFTQVDLKGLSASRLSRPQSLNLYAYVEGNPTNSTDRLGLCDGEPDECQYLMDHAGSEGPGPSPHESLCGLGGCSGPGSYVQTEFVNGPGPGGAGYGHYEWWDYYSNGKKIGSSEKEWIWDLSPTILPATAPSIGGVDEFFGWLKIGFGTVGTTTKIVGWLGKGTTLGNIASKVGTRLGWLTLVSAVIEKTVKDIVKDIARNNEIDEMRWKWFREMQDRGECPPNSICAGSWADDGKPHIPEGGW